MKKINAIQSYLVSQYRYDIQLGWMINGLICIFFLVFPLFFGNQVIFGVTPSAAIYVITAVHGIGWIYRTLGYLLRLGVNRKMFSIGTLVFSSLFSFINTTLITLICLIHELIKTNVDGYKLFFLHPASLLVEDPSLIQIFAFDFILLNIIFLFAVLISITYHRIGKLGGNLTITILFILLVVNIFSNGLVALVQWVSDVHTMYVMAVALLIIALLCMCIIIATKRISISKSNI